jgi:hypothetical protein
MKMLSRLFCGSTGRRARAASADLRFDPDLDEIFAQLGPPRALRSPSAWDDYWQRQLKAGVATLGDMLFDKRELIAVMRSRGLKRVFIAGNGLSDEPVHLATAGFDVTVMDISPIAIALMRRAAEGSTASFVLGDLFDETLCRGPFDVVIERRTAQGYPDAERDLLLVALAARLQPHGLFVSHCHDGSWRPPNEPRHVTGQWFRAQGWHIAHAARDLPRSERSAWLVTSTG